MTVSPAPLAFASPPEPPSGPSTPPCTPYATLDDICPPCDTYEMDATLLEANLIAASEWLFEASGGRFPGVCEMTVRPCSRYTYDMHHGYGGHHGHGGWDMLHAACACQAGRPCGCCTLSEITLGGYPVREILEVRVADDSNPTYDTAVPDSDILSPTLYRVDDFRWLVRLPNPDGSEPSWPCCQDLGHGIGEPDTFYVTFTYGREAPALAKSAAAALACQLTLACTPGSIGQCTLPARTQQVVRQGVTITTIASPDFRTDLMFSVPAVGLFLSAFNRAGIGRRAVVTSPDVKRRIRRADT